MIFNILIALFSNELHNFLANINFANLRNIWLLNEHKNKIGFN